MSRDVAGRDGALQAGEVRGRGARTRVAAAADGAAGRRCGRRGLQAGGGGPPAGGRKRQPAPRATPPGLGFPSLKRDLQG